MTIEIFNCIECSASFNLDENSPRILPCNNTICLNCLKKNARSIGGFRVPCKCPEKSHNQASIDDFYPCEAIINFLKSDQADTPPVDNLKAQLNSSRFSLNVAKYDANRHYDAMEMDVEIRAETLIGLIHDKRDQLLEKIKTFRNQTDAEFDSITDQHTIQYSDLEQTVNKIVGPLSVSGVLVQADLDQMICNFNKIQRSIESVRSDIYQFIANTIDLDSTLLGVFLNKTVDVTYSKVQNLSVLINDEKNSHTVELQSSLTEHLHRQYIVPLSQERTIGINFTSTRSISLELFDETGAIIKTAILASNASYYPIYSSTSDKLVISYLDERSVTNVVLFDKDLNQLKASRLQNLIESIFMNTKNIVCTFVHKSADACIVFDLNLSSVDTFGQKLQPEEGFFFSVIEDTKDFRAKKNPTVFGLNESRIYFYSTSEMIIMCRRTGSVLGRFEKKADSYFILDSYENTIEVDTISKEVLFRSMDMGINASSRYQITATNVFLVEDQFITFVDSKSKKLTFV